MHKIIATVLTALFLFPTGSFAQASKANGWTIGQENSTTTSMASMGTLREAAVRHARLAVAAPNAAVQAPRTGAWAKRHSVLVGTLLGAAAGAAVALFGTGAVNGCSDADCRFGYARAGAVAGAGAGALIGFGVSVARP